MKKNITLFLFLCVIFTIEARAAIASSIAACLTADKKSVQSRYVTMSASKMYCEVMSKSKYPIKFQAYGSNQIDGTYAKNYYTVTYNVNASGTQSIGADQYNCNSIKLSGNNVGTVKKGCIGWGKLY